VLAGLTLAGLAWATYPDTGRLHVIFLDISGDGVLVQSPGGKYMLIDGGEEPSRLAMYLGRYLPFWRRTLDVVVLTRSDETRLPGQIAALARYRAALALAPPHMHLTPQHNPSPASLSSIHHLEHEWFRLLNEHHTPTYVARAAQQLAFDGATVSVVITGHGETSGVVLKLVYGKTSIVLAGASDEVDDEALLAVAHPVTVLAYPWQREIKTPLLDAWHPQAIVFTTAYESDTPALRTFFERACYGSRLYHPELDGTIEVVSDGHKVWIETERS
jgi:beta-lactamase superfamily II metal-dependent hydrolase